MPKICCFFVKLEEIKKKLNKIKKLMGETFQNFRAYGKSVVVERQKNIVIERSDDNIITRKQTIIREKILNDANTLSPPQKPNDLNVNTAKTKPINNSAFTTGEKEQIVNSKHTILSARTTTTTTATASPLDNIYLPDSTKAFSASELASLKQDIDDEIANLKLQRNTLLQKAISTARENAKMREKKPVKTQIQNDMTWGQNFASPKAAETIELQFEKFSSEQNIQTTMRQPKRDEQTSCRPRMRTIGLQKNTQRSSATPKPETNLPLHKSLLNLQYNSTCETIPTAFGCFDYGPSCCPTNDNCRQLSNSHSGCQSYCQRYNLSGDYSGIVCNRNTYCHAGCTPCSEYNYCHDEYYYDYSNVQSPQQHTHMSKRLPCCCHADSRPADYQQKRKKCHHSEQKKDRAHMDQYEEEQQVLTKKYLLQQITKQQRDLEREGARALALKAAHLKFEQSNKKEHRGEKLQDENDARIKALFARSKGASKKAAIINSDDSDTGEPIYHLKQERLKVTKKRSYRSPRSPSSNNDCGYYEDISSDATRQGDYNYKTKRTLERMRLHSYRPAPRRAKAETLSDTAERNGKGMKKENRYDDYITQYKTDPLNSKPAANKSIQTSVRLAQQEYPTNRLESAADEPGLKTKPTDPKSTQTSYVTPSKAVTKTSSDKRVSAHDGNEQWESPIYIPQPARTDVPPQELPKDQSVQKDAQTSKPLSESIKRSSSVKISPPLFVHSDQVQNERKQSDIRTDKISSSIGGSFFSREDAYQKASRKVSIPTDVSPFELLAMEESLSQDSPGQSPQEQLSTRDHLLRGEYQPDRSTDDKVPVRDHIPKVEGLDDGTMGVTSEKEYSEHNLRNASSREMEQEQTYLERAPTTAQVERISRDSAGVTSSHIPVSTNHSSQNGRSSRQDSPSSPEARTPRESFKREGSYISESPKLSTLTEHPTQENIRGDRSYAEDERKLGYLEKLLAPDNLKREGSFIIESHHRDSQERSARERMSQQSSNTPGARRRNSQERQPSRDRSLREEQSRRDSHDFQKTGALRYSQKRTSEENSPREHTSVQRSNIPERQRRSTQERQPSLDRSLTEEDRVLKEKQLRRASYDSQDTRSLRDSQKLSSRENSPRERASPQRSNNEERKKKSLQERQPSLDRSLRKEQRSLKEEHLRRDSHDSQKPNSLGDSHKRSLQEHSPGEQLFREESLLRATTTEGFFKANKDTQRERYLGEDSFTQDSQAPTRNVTPRKERTQREDALEILDQKGNFSREASFMQGSQVTLDHTGQSKRPKREETVPSKTQDQTLRRESSPRKSLTRESNFERSPRNSHTLKREASPRKSLTRESSFERSARDSQTLKRESSPRKSLTRESSFERSPRDSQTLKRESPPRKSLTRESSFERSHRNSQDSSKLRGRLLKQEDIFQDHHKPSTSQTPNQQESLNRQKVDRQDIQNESSKEQRTPRQSFTRQGSFTIEQPNQGTALNSNPQRLSNVTKDESFNKERQEQLQNSPTRTESKLPDSLTTSSRDQYSPRVEKNGSFDRDRQEPLQSSQIRAESNLRGSFTQSSRDQHLPKVSKDGSFDRDRQASLQSSLTKADSKLQGSFTGSSRDQYSPRVEKNGRFERDRQEPLQSSQIRAESNLRGSFTQSSRDQNLQKVSKDGSFHRDRQALLQSSLTKADSKLQGSFTGSSRDQRLPNVQIKGSFDKDNHEENTIDQKPQHKRFKDSVNEKDQQDVKHGLETHLSPRDQGRPEEEGTKLGSQITRPARKSLDQASLIQESEAESQNPQHVIPSPKPTIETSPPVRLSTVDGSGKQSTPIAQLREGNLQSTRDHPQRSSKREENSFTASQVRQDSPSPRRRSRDGSFDTNTHNNQTGRESLTSRKRLSNIPSFRAPTSMQKENFLTDVHSLRGSNELHSDVNQTRASNLSPISSQRRRSSQLRTQSPRWTKEEVFYPYMNYVSESQQPNTPRFSKQDSIIQYKLAPYSEHAKDIPARVYEKRDNEMPLPELENCECECDWQNECKTLPPIICPEVCMDIPYPCVPCDEPQPVFDVDQIFNAQDDFYYDQQSMMARTPINGQVYQERQMVYTEQCYDPCAVPCPCPYNAELRLQDNTYDEQATTTTTVSSLASGSETNQVLKRTQQIFTRLDTSVLEQHQLRLQPEQPLPLQLQPISRSVTPCPVPQFCPSQRFESDEEYLQQLDLNKTLLCSNDVIQQENVFFCNDDADDVRFVNFDVPPVKRNEDCRCDGDMNQNIEYGQYNYESFTGNCLQRLPSDCTVTSAYATASSGISYTNLVNNDNVDSLPPTQSSPSPPKPACECKASSTNLTTRHQNRVIPKYTGCPCMFATYMEMMDLAIAGAKRGSKARAGLGNEVPSKDKDECVKRISFR